MNKVAIMRMVRTGLMAPHKITNYLRHDMPIACNFVKGAKKQ